MNPVAEPKPAANLGPRSFLQSARWPGFLLLVLVCVFPELASAQGLALPFALDIIRENKQISPVADNDQPAPQSLGSISGKILDQSGAPINGVKVQLRRVGSADEQETLTNEDGLFAFSNIAPGPFRLSVSFINLAPKIVEGVLHPNETLRLRDTVLAIASQVTEVVVAPTPQEIAKEQVHAQEQQRVFGLVPNFFVTYDPHPVPLPAKLKFELAWKSAVDPFTFVAVGAVAGVEQATNQWRGYGQGAEGYAKRYGASYANVFTGTFIGGAVLPSILKQDPRYYYRGKGSTRSRLLYALANTVMCRGDNGKWQPNYSNVGGAFASGALANLYYPADQRTGGRVIVSTALIRLGETAVASVFQEFFVRKLSSGGSAHNKRSMD